MPSGCAFSPAVAKLDACLIDDKGLIPKVGRVDLTTQSFERLCDVLYEGNLWFMAQQQKYGPAWDAVLAAPKYMSRLLHEGDPVLVTKMDSWLAHREVIS